MSQSDETQSDSAVNKRSRTETIEYYDSSRLKELTTNDRSNPFKSTSADRYVLFPIKYPKIWEKYKNAQSVYWTAEEIDFSQDQKGWKKLSSSVQNYIKLSLAFFAASDGIVMENLSMNFINEVQIPEARCFYSFQNTMEGIHSETYSILIDTLIQDQEEQTKLFRAVENFPGITLKAEWSTKWISSAANFATRLVAFSVVEGIFFSGSFLGIFWLKKQGNKLPGLTFSNELISRDEGLHTDFACLLYSMIPVEFRLTEQEIYSIIGESVKVEEIFIAESLPVSLIGMNVDSAIQYIKFVADRLIKSLGYTPLYKVNNPFEWMNLISLEGKTNFFERRVSDYSVSGVNSQKSHVQESSIFDADENF